nr:putative disease resistance protein rpp1 [Quercus suber]
MSLFNFVCNKAKLNNWIGIKNFDKLTFVDLTDFSDLIITPNFTGVPNLEKLVLEIFLDRTAVVELIENMPENLWIVEGLEVLDLSKADMEELPSSIEHLTNLTSLTLRYCVNLVRLPNTICSMKLLNSIDLFGCLKFGNLPRNIGNVKGLELLNLCWTAIEEGQSDRLPDILDIIIPGGEIPKWFNHECMGNELKIQVPYGCDELMGIVLRVCFSFAKVSHTSKDFLLTCWIKVNGFERASPIRSFFRTKYGKVRTRHLWLLYLSPRYFDSQWGEKFRQIDVNGSNKIAIRISSSNDLGVAKTGIHLVYKHCLFEDLGVIYQDINDSASKGTRNKRSHDEDDGAGPSGEVILMTNHL